MPDSISKTLILGLGNPFRGDDGIGAAVVAALRDQDLPPDIIVVDGGPPGLETVLIWQGYERVIIVNAAEMGIAPGVWKRFLSDEAVLHIKNESMRGTLHDAGLAEALALAAALDMLPSDLVFYCVQPSFTGWSADLTAPVAAAILSLCSAISSELAAYSIDY